MWNTTAAGQDTGAFQQNILYASNKCVTIYIACI
jgi:hypothetical protein